MKILIVDDEQDARDYLESLLSSEGHTVTVAVDGQEALDLVNKGLPDLVISDGLMPRMDGFELCQQMKRDHELHKIPFILYTATYLDKEDEELAEAVGVDCFLTKPLEADPLVDAINQVMVKAYQIAEPVSATERNEIDILERHRDVLTQKLEKKRAQLCEREELEEELREHAKVFQNAQEAIMITDADHRITQINPAFTQITQYTEKETIGQTPRLLRSEHHDTAFYEKLQYELKQKGRWQGELWNRRKNGEIFPAWSTITAVQNDQGQINHYISIFSDISEKKLADQHIRHLAHHDLLTDLPNRLLFEERCEHAIVRADRGGNQVAVMFLDLDKFKPINDKFGHLTGDEVLQQLARRLEKAVRGEDTVARIGGDEFVVVLDSINQPEDADLVANKIILSLDQPFEIQGNQLRVGISIGISIYPKDGSDVKTLMEKADSAMYIAKNKGSNRYEFYHSNTSDY